MVDLVLTKAESLGLAKIKYVLYLDQAVFWHRELESLDEDDETITTFAAANLEASRPPLFNSLSLYTQLAGQMLCRPADHYQFTTALASSC